MQNNRDNTCRILVPSGVLGAGCPDAAFQRGLTLRPNAVAVDAGSTDSGPYYLGTGRSKMTDAAIRRDLTQMIPELVDRKIPLIIGSSGTCGSDAGVDHLADICRDILSRTGQAARIARIYSELSTERIVDYVRRGRVRPLPPMTDLTAAQVNECVRIVGLAGHQPFVDALLGGADIVLAGRATDTAVISAVPLMLGFPEAHCWHAAKIAECGGMCTERADLGGVMLEIGVNGFVVEPLHADNLCTPRTVSAHMLYENSDPFTLVEPGVVLSVEDAVYKAIDERSVHVSGASAQNTPPTIKLEGVRLAGYQTMSFVAISEPAVLGNVEGWLRALREQSEMRISKLLGYSAGDYLIDFRPYGAGALNPLPEGSVPLEVGLMVIATADTQEKAREILRLCNPLLLHFPYDRSAPMPSFAFPFSPAEVDRGAVFEFCLNHVVEVDRPGELHDLILDEVVV